MKTIGLLGGMSWESSLEYYRMINEAVRARLGGLHSGKIIMYSVDFADIESLQHEGKWDECTEIMIDAAVRVQKGGADILLICTNTMHRMADEVQRHIEIPLLHIADATAEKIRAASVTKVGLLGTRFTMEEDFYKGRLIAGHGLNVIVPPERARENLHRVIYEELCLGKISPSSREATIHMMDALVQEGAEGIILGCTEIGLLIRQEDSKVPVFDTTRIHALAAVEYALGS